MIATLVIKEAKKRSAQPKEERTTTNARAKKRFSSKAALHHPACSPSWGGPGRFWAGPGGFLADFCRNFGGPGVEKKVAFPRR